MRVIDLLRSLQESHPNPLQYLDDVHGVVGKLHEDGRCILDYDMIRAKKEDEVARECRGLVLDSQNEWNLVARGFRRFFNAGEIRNEDHKFNWDNEVQCTHKEDGSFILLYFHNGWKINTRFSFAEHAVSDSPLTWTDLFKLGFDFTKATALNEEYTYVFELCSRYNKIVRDYAQPKVYLLTVFHGEMELNWYATQDIAKELGVESVDSFVAQDLFQVQAYIAKIAERDRTFEGIVVRDVFNNRLKVKSLFYIQLHRLNNNGNLASVKNLVPLIMAGAKAEIITYYPELTQQILEIEQKIANAYKEIDNVWFCHNDEPNQKKFAQTIMKETKHTAPLFSARKEKKHPKDFWTPEYVLRSIFGV